MKENHRILIVDDNPTIHEDFRKILAPASALANNLTEAEVALFGAAPSPSTSPFEIDSANQGEEAVTLLRQSVAEGRPYAMAFVDIRMPPGWDGVETISRLWEIDPDLQAVICTAYSDYSWYDIAGKLVASHNLVILKKPFDNIEVLQLAHSLTHKWSLGRQAQDQLSVLNTLVAERTREVDLVNADLRVEIAERRRAENVLRESEERFRAFMDNSPVIAFMKDEQGRYVYLNKPFEDTFQMKLSEWYGRNDFAAWSPEIAAQVRAHDEEVFTSGSPMQFIEHMPVPNRSNDEWLVLKFTMRDHSGQRFIGGVGIDVTERNQLEAQLRQAQKLEAVGQLAGGVAHDFNNILAVIIGYTEAAASRVEPGEVIAQNLSEITKAAHRGTGLITQLSSFSRKQATRPRVIDVNSVLIDIDKILHRLVREDIFMTLLLGPEAGCIKAEPGQIEQVVINLVVNARDAMPRGGELRIETQPSFLAPTEAERHGVAAGDYVIIQVSDTGTGMSAETQARIFEPFFTTKAEGQGTGLGLATCYGIAKQNGGFITVRSEPGCGSTFQIYLPRTNEAAETAAKPQRTADVPRGAESILVVEDDEALRALTADNLRELGYHVSEAGDGATAQRMMAASDGTRYDLVLTDVGMPHVDGATLGRWIHAEHPSTQVLLVSGYAGDHRLTNDDVAFDHRFLAKPFTRTQLAITVRKALESNGTEAGR